MLVDGFGGLFRAGDPPWDFPPPPPPRPLFGACLRAGKLDKAKTRASRVNIVMSRWPTRVKSRTRGRSSVAVRGLSGGDGGSWKLKKNDFITFSSSIKKFKKILTFSSNNETIIKIDVSEYSIYFQIYTYIKNNYNWIRFY